MHTPLHKLFPLARRKNISLKKTQNAIHRSGKPAGPRAPQATVGAASGLQATNNRDGYQGCNQGVLYRAHPGLMMPTTASLLDYEYPLKRK